MSAREGPPRNDAAGPSPKEPAAAAESDNSTTNARKDTTTPRRGRAYAHAFRYGFGCGFRDALRLAARRLPPDTWAHLEAIARQYELAGGE